MSEGRSALEDLQSYLHREMPLSAAMGVTVLAVDESGARLGMPLAPNLNHRETLFGGSAAALAILAGWTLVHERLAREEDVASHLVIQRGSIEYLEPVAGDVEASCPSPPEDLWTRFVQTLRRRGRARISVGVELHWEGRVTGRFTGTFVAVERAGPEAAEGP